MSLPMTPTANFKTKTKTKTKTKFWKDLTCAIFLKSWGFKDIKYDTLASSAHHQHIISAKSVHHQCIISASSANHQCTISASSVHHQRTRPDQTRPDQTRPGQKRLQSRGPDSRTCVLVKYVLCLFSLRIEMLQKEMSLYSSFRNAQGN